ncbi:MAG: hypothetical protein ACJ754_00395 [Pyrinomonadaceae bacterium]
MDGNVHLNLPQSLALVDASLRAARSSAQAFGFAADDPLRLDLPPVSGAGGLVPDAVVLRVMASLYLHAELEQAGIIPVAELLAGQRYDLKVTSEKAARLLEEFWRRSRQWYDRESRNRIYARLFGSGQSARRDEGQAVNREFQQRLANLCGVLVGYSEQYRFGQRPTASQEALVREVALDLLTNLGARQYGNTNAAAGQLQEQLRRAIELLNDEGVASLFGARGMWDVLRKILGPETPDLGRLITRGQSGLHILDWLASALPQINETTPGRLLLPADATVFTLAASWLEASGFQVARGEVKKRVA